MTDPSPDGGGISLTDDSWSESTVTWDTRPAITGTAISTLGAVSLDSFVEFDITGDDTYDFALKNNSSDSVY